MNFIEKYLSHGAEKNNPKRIVIHSMGEYIKDPDPMLAVDFLDKMEYSAHALILPHGDIMMCRRPEQGANHARGFNTDSLGIEFLVEGAHDYGSFLKKIQTNWVKADQFQAGIELVKHWKSIYNINVMDRHSDISPGRKLDPGDGFHWKKFKHETGF